MDLYDCRRRLWYNQAINSPKDVVILTDMSGSMTGSHFTLAKLVVQSLIDTLQQDDFFNVLYFNKDTKYVLNILFSLEILRLHAFLLSNFLFDYDENNSNEPSVYYQK